MHINTRLTAFAIARVRAEEAARSERERLFTDTHAQLFDDPHQELGQLFGALPFFREHVRLRTRFFDDEVRAALAAGIRTIVLLGAGFDTRALRLPEVASARARIIEVDYPDQLVEKWQRLEDAGAPRPEHVSCAGLDLGTPDLEARLVAELAQAGVAHPAPILWICEGLVGYLDAPTLERLSAASYRASGSGSRIVANHFCPVLSAEVMRAFLAHGGWEPSRTPSFAELHARLIDAEVPAGSDLFGLVAAEKP